MVKFAVVLVLVLVLLLVVNERADARAGLGRLDLDLLERSQVLRSPRTREVAAVREAEVLSVCEVVAHRRAVGRSGADAWGAAGDGDAPGEGRHGHACMPSWE